MQTNIQKLIDIMASLRHKETGCSWDLQQDYQTLASMTVEETYELVDAITKNDIANIKEELGDILFHLVFYARIAEEKGDFNFANVIDEVSEKMIRRHPHIFAGKIYANSEEQKQDWHRIKAEEKALKLDEKMKYNPDYSDNKNLETEMEVFSNNAKLMPSLEQSVLVQQSMANLGFDWNDSKSVLPKIAEELEEVTEALDENFSQDLIEEEYGDLLFAVLNLGRKLEFDSDIALRKANRKFVRRSVAMVEMMGNKKAFSNLPIDEKEDLWIAVKRNEKK